MRGINAFNSTFTHTQHEKHLRELSFLPLSIIIVIKAVRNKTEQSAPREISNYENDKTIK